MIQIPMKSAGPLTKQTVLSVNRQYIQGARTSENIGSINHRPGNGSYAGNNNGAVSPACGERKAPPLQRPCLLYTSPSPRD